jgi:predicted molibdopterin-dependent oxidoreductase YjgC
MIVTVDGRAVEMEEGASVVAALVLADRLCTRLSVSGEPRFALCGMGQCQECRVTIDGQPHRLACMAVCRAGMAVLTGGQA